MNANNHENRVLLIPRCDMGRNRDRQNTDIGLAIKRKQYLDKFTLSTSSKPDGVARGCGLTLSKGTEGRTDRQVSLWVKRIFATKLLADSGPVSERGNDNENSANMNP